jgi:hypothetical protein
VSQAKVTLESMSGIEGATRFQAESRPCREVYGGDCGIRVGPPEWKHKPRRNSGGVHHPTREQALFAARNPSTPTDCLRALGEWDKEQYGDVRAAARANPSYRES